MANGNSLKGHRAPMKLKTRRTLIAYSFLLIPLMFYLSIRIFPALYAFSMSFSLQDSSVFTFENYTTLMQDEIFWKSVSNTFLYVLITVPLQLAFGLMIALAIERVTHFRWFYRIVFFLPYMTSIVAVSWVWRLIFEPSAGVLNSVLTWLHIPAQSWLNDPSLALVSISIVIVWQMMGFNMLIFIAGLQTIPRQLYEAARIDGAGKWKLFWNITFPLLNPTIVFLTIIGVIQTLQTFTQIANLTGGSKGIGGPLHSTSSIVVYMYNQGFREFNLNYASAVTVFLFIMILIITLVQFKLINRSYKL